MAMGTDLFEEEQPIFIPSWKRWLFLGTVFFCLSAIMFLCAYGTYEAVLEALRVSSSIEEFFIAAIKQNNYIFSVLFFCIPLGIAFKKQLGWCLSAFVFYCFFTIVIVHIVIDHDENGMIFSIPALLICLLNIVLLNTTVLKRFYDVERSLLVIHQIALLFIAFLFTMLIRK
jgi:hypothetical protein